MLGLLQFQQGKYPDARRLIERAVAINPRFAPALANYGNVLNVLGEKEAALAAYRAALESDRDNFDANYGLGLCYLKANDPDAAENHLLISIRIRPESAVAHAQLGIVFHEQQRHVEAVREYSKALELDSTVAGWYRYRGSAYQFLGEHKKAVADFSECVRRNPQSAPTHYGLGTSLRRLDDIDGAVAEYREALKIDPGFAWARNDLGNALRAKGQYEEAVKQFEQSVKLNSNDADAYCYLGAAYLEMGKPEHARTAILRSHNLNPYNRRQLAYLATALQMCGDKEAAARLLDFDHLLQRYRLDVPAGYASLDEFNEALVKHVTTHDTLSFERAGNTTHKGHQTGNLLDADAGPVEHLAALLQGVIRTYFSGLPRDPSHPYMAWQPDAWRLVAWGVVLGSQGYQAAHIHPDGWLSGVYYVKVPGEVTRAVDSQPDGWLEVGRPPEQLGSPQDPLLALERPEAGIAVLFPSYFYHRTIPFESSKTRISIGFDVQPRIDQ